MDIQAAVTQRLAHHGWAARDRIISTVYSKDFATFATPKEALVRLTYENEFDRFWLKGESFVSAGDNVIATCIALFPAAVTEPCLQADVDAFVAQVEKAIAGSYAVRMRTNPA